MRRIQRAALPKVVQNYLRKRQLAASDKHKNGDLNIERDWKSARQTKPLKAVVATLQTMMGPRQRCMYCLDSHGADIEHFRPKAVYPKRMYEWPNLLLCCTECGRFKGNKFPMSGRHALLIDPTREDPWKHLDFDPVTGNISARFDLQLNDWSAKGAATVDVLKLDRREALSAGYLKTLRHLSDIVERALLGG
ncbi:MAG: TIGR02646 family protein, partial [Betaproteobacteria bacterium HGW-Betaproteobacteria-18]